MPDIEIGQIGITEGQQAPPLLIPENRPITELQLELSGNLVVTGAVTLTEDAILRLLRRVQIVVGGRTIKNIGTGANLGAAGIILHHNEQLDTGQLPQKSDPATAIGTNAFSASLRIPFAMPQKPTKNAELHIVRKSLALVTGDRETKIIVDWGNDTDLFSAGAATLSEVKLTVAAVTDTDEQLMQLISALVQTGQKNILTEYTQRPSLQAGASTAEELSIDRNGALHHSVLYGYDNSLRAHDVFNNFEYVMNSSDIYLKKSMALLRHTAKSVGELQATDLPTGVGLALFDLSMDGENTIPLNDSELVKSFKLRLDHDAITGTGAILHHHRFIESEK